MVNPGDKIMLNEGMFGGRRGVVTGVGDIPVAPGRTEPVCLVALDGVQMEFMCPPSEFVVLS